MKFKKVKKIQQFQINGVRDLTSQQKLKVIYHIKVKRNLGILLKSLAYPWVTSQKGHICPLVSSVAHAKMPIFTICLISWENSVIISDT